MTDVIERRLAELGDFIRQQREVTRMSVRRLADLAGVSNPYLSQMERGLRKPSADILQQIAKALHVSAETLYVRAGILDDEEPMTISVPEAIERDEFLTPEQKLSLLTVYESFISHGDPEAPPKKTAAAKKPAATTAAAAKKAAAPRVAPAKKGAD